MNTHSLRFLNGGGTPRGGGQLMLQQHDISTAKASASPAAVPLVAADVSRWLPLVAADVRRLAYGDEPSASLRRPLRLRRRERRLRAAASALSSNFQLPSPHLSGLCASAVNFEKEATT